jgi:uncharacterized membrane protein YjfL (UPF0719 family)
MRDHILVFLAHLQSMPFGEHLVEIASKGMLVLVAGVAVAACMMARGWVNWLVFVTAEEKQKLHDGNPAFVLNQLLVYFAFILALGASLVNTASIPAYLDKIAVAFFVQVVAMIVLRVVFRKAHHQMMRGNVSAGARLGCISLGLGILTMFVMMR